MKFEPIKTCPRCDKKNIPTITCKFCKFSIFGISADRWGYRIIIDEYIVNVHIYLNCSFIYRGTSEYIGCIYSILEPKTQKETIDKLLILI
jgi:hypothetical protein